MVALPNGSATFLVSALPDDFSCSLLPCFPCGNGLIPCVLRSDLSHEEPPELEELIRLVAGKLVRVLDCFHPALGALGLGLKLFEIGGVSL